ncbi:flagellin [Pseudoalteromonas shioyasakiensis]|uniref:flagellin n=1 Tax=Pseudoalteromonas shioyasakiensis TaxID=1190813 RepID=UPI0021173EAF|nr:flagellin [Pseudoalteromonas shioyasakiensis]MCQ8877508.1 flagellin [Pseudoalteromonas shioyasakiensis]
MLVKSSEKTHAPEAINMAKSEPFVTQAKERPENQAINKVTAKQEQVAVLSRWSIRGQLSQALAQTEHSEVTLKQMFNALDKLAKQLNTQAATDIPQVMQQANIQSKVNLLQQLAAQPGSGLNKQLKLASENSLSVRQLNANIDLISVRPHDERIQLLMGRSGKSVILNLPANQGEAKNLEAIQGAFDKQEINVELGRDNRLLFSATKDQAGLLDEPWIMSGQGIRVAAGNPISVPLEEPQNPLQQLAKIAESNSNIQAHRDKIKQVQQQLKTNLFKIQAQRKELASQLEQIEKAASAEQNSQLSDDSNRISEQMFSSGTNNIATIMAQANVTRSIVRFSLY